MAKYASRTATFGSVAYDLNALQQSFNEAAYAEPERTAPAPDRTAAPAKKERTRARVKMQATAQPVSISAFSVIGFAAAAVMIVLLMLSYVRITEINDAKTELRNHIAALDTEAEQLRVKYETTFNLNEIEDYAAHTLGMVRLTDSSTSVVQSGRIDTGVVISDNDGGSGALSGFAEFISSLLEYLK